MLPNRNLYIEWVTLGFSLSPFRNLEPLVLLLHSVHTSAKC